MESGLIGRIRARLRVTGQSANAASARAGLNRDYISDLFIAARDGHPTHPRIDTMRKLADALECSHMWLTTGEGPINDAEESDERQARETKLKLIFSELPDEEQSEALILLEALQAKATLKQQKPAS